MYTNTIRTFRLLALTLGLLSGLVASAQTPITINTVVTNSIVASETNLYSLNLASGQTIYADAITGSQSRYRWFMNAPSGAVVFDRSHNDPGVLQLSETGSYEIGIYSPTATAGDTTFAVYDVPVAVPLPIVVDQVVTNTINSPGESNLYSISISAPLRLYADAITGSINGYNWQLTDPLGAVVFQALNYSDPGGNVFELTESGVYTLLVDGSGDRLGTYSFSLEEVPTNPDLTFDLDEEVAGQFDVSGESQRYQVAIVAPVRVYADAITGSLTAFNWSLTDPLGTTIFSNANFNDPGGNVFDLTESGTYTLEIDGNGDRTGAYTFMLEEVPSNPDITFNLDEDVSGQFDVSGESQRYEVEIAAPVRVYANAITGSSTAFNWNLTDPLGTPVFSTSNYFDPNVNVLELTESGTYELMVDGNGDRTGPYTFNLHSVPTNPPLPLRYHEPLEGELFTPGEVQEYVFEGFAGELLGFQRILGGTTRLAWILNDSLGNQIGSGPNFLNRLLPVLPADDIYTLVIDGVGDSVAPYEFVLHKVPPTVSRPLAFGEIVHDVLTTPLQAFEYTFDLTAGDALSLDVLSNPGGTARFRLIRPGGGTEFSGQFGDFTDNAVTETGTYTLLVTGQSEIEIGPFAFRVFLGSTIPAEPGSSDLAVESIGFTPSTQVADPATVTVEWTVRNIGSNTTAMASWTDRLYLSSLVLNLDAFQPDRLQDLAFSPIPYALDGNGQMLELPSQDLIEVALVARTGSLAPGASYTASATATLPDGFTGDFYVAVFADAFNEEFELTNDGELNNLVASTNFVGIEAEARPSSGTGLVELDLADGAVLPANTPFVLSGRARIVPEQLNVAFVIDNSFSTTAPSGFDANFDGVVDARDDYDGDGTIGDVYDAEIGAIDILINLLNAQGVDARISIMSFSGYNAYQDLSAAFLNQSWISASQDEDGNGTNDLIDVISAQVRTFGTDFILASDGLAPLLEIQPMAQATEVFFFTDGEAGVPTLSPAIQAIGDAGVNFHAYQISNPTLSTALQELANLIDANPASDGEAVLVEDPDDLALSVLQTLNIAGLTVNDQGVASLDPSGRFFTPLTLQPGTNLIPIVVYDSEGNAFTETLTLIGRDPGVVQLQDVSHLAALQGVRSTWNPVTASVLAEIAVANLSDFDLPTPLTVRLSLAPSSVSTAPAGDLSFGSGSALAAGASTASQVITFNNPQDVRFLPQAQILVPANLPPVFVNTPNALAPTGRLWSFDTGASDPDGDVVTLSVQVGPDNLAVSGTSVSWTPNVADAGQHTVTLIADDGRGGRATFSFLLTVEQTPANRPPLFESVPVTASNSGLDYQYVPTVLDPDGDAVTFSLTSPAGFTADAVTGAISASGPADGVYNLTLTATDTEGASAEQTWVLDIGSAASNPNVPVFRSTPPLVAVPGENYLYLPLVQDADGDVLSFSAPTAPSNSTLDVASGRLDWVPTLTDIGFHPILLRADDGNGGVGTQFYTVEVTTNAPNRSPVILSSPAFVAEAGTLYEYAMRAIDPDGQLVQYNVVGGPAGMSITAGTGQLSWTPAAASLGSQPVTLRASDPSGAFAEQAFSIEVRGTNTAPVIVSSAPTSVSAGASYTYPVLVEDPDPLTFELTAAPSFLSIDPLGGLVSGSPSAADIGNYPVSIRVTDDRGASDVQSFILDVTPDTTPPEVTVQVVPQYANPGQLVAIQVTALDDVGVASLALTVDGAPVALDGAGIASFTPNAPGLLPVVATATDAAGNAGMATDSLRVFDAGDTGTPVIVITSPTNQSVITAPTDIIGSVTDPEGNLDYYVLEYILASELPMQAVGDSYAFVLEADGFTEFARGTGPVVNGVLGQFDPTVLPNDDYVVRVTAFDINGLGRTEGVFFGVAGGLKLGLFELEVEDLTVPLAGVPIQFIRRYSSFNSAEQGDFGYGWALSVCDPDLRETTPDTGDSIFTASPLRSGARVYLNTPEGRRIGFTFEPEFTRSALLGALYRAVFVPDPGVFETLELPPELDIQFGLNPSGDAILFGIPFPFNPDVYVLTDRAGVRRTYDQRRGLISIEDAAGSTITVTPTGLRHDDGTEVLIDRDAEGRIVRITDPEGAFIQYVYDTAGDLVSVIDRDGEMQSYTYHTQPRPHLIDSYAFSAGAPRRAEFDEDGRLVAIVEANGVRSEFSHDPAAFTGTYTDGEGNVSIQEYDDVGNLTREISAIGTSRSFTHDPDGNVLTETDANGGVTTMTYDDGGNMTSATDPMGGMYLFDFNAAGKMVRWEEPDGAVIHYGYDAFDRMAAITNPLDHVASFAYSADNHLETMTDYSGDAYQFTVNNGARSVTTDNPDGTDRVATYTVNGDPLTMRRETGGVVEMRYSAEGVPTTEIFPDGTQNLVQFVADRELSRTDALGRTTRSEYTLEGELSATILADGATTHRSYDGNAEMRTLTDAIGNVHSNTYNQVNQLVAELDPTGAPRNYAYDPVGNRTEIIDRNNRRRTFEYNGRNQMTRETWFGTDGVTSLRTIDYTYTVGGEITSFSDPDATGSLTYDAIGKPTQEDNTGTPGVPSVVLDTTYGTSGNPTKTVSSEGVSVDSVWTSTLRIGSRSWSGGGIDDVRLEWDYESCGCPRAADLRRFSDAAGTTAAGHTAFSYDINPRLTEILHVAADGTGLLQLDYGRTAAGEVASLSRNGASTAFSYDLAGQLIRAAGPGGTESFSWDPAGNPAGAMLTAGNRLAADGGIQYLYDAEGNMTQRVDTVSGDIDILGYDHRNRMVSFFRESGGVTTVAASYRYDAMNRRIAKTVNGVTTVTVYHGHHAWADYDDVGNVLERYLFAPGMDELLARWRPGEDTAWILSDHLGSVLGVVNHAGTMLSETEYSAFGERRSQTGAADAVSFGFTGQRYDAESALYHYRNRSYDPRAKRFTSVDPLGFEAGDPNLYRYVGNIPTGARDPLGTVSASELADILCHIIGLVNLYNTLDATFITPIGIVSTAIAGGGGPPAGYKPPPPPSPPGGGGVLDFLCTAKSLGGG